MDSSGRIHEIDSEEQFKALEKKHGKLLEVGEHEVGELKAASLKERIKHYKKNTLNLKKPATRDGSFTRKKFDRSRIKKLKKISAKSRSRNRK